MTHPPVVFVHGRWMHASSWDPWIDRFRAAGYEATAAIWPGDPADIEEARRHPRSIAGRGIEEIVEHHKRCIGGLESRPIVIGHSFGGLIAQRLLAEDFAVAGVATDPAPIKGVLRLPLSSLEVELPILRDPVNRHRPIALTAAQFRYGFGNAVSAAESDELYRKWAIPGSGRPLFEAAFASVMVHSPTRVDTRNAIRGHCLTLDSGWVEIADAVLAWLPVKSL